MRRNIFLAVLLAVALVIVAAPAVFAAYPGDPAVPPSGSSGTTVTWRAGGFSPGEETVTFRFCQDQVIVGTDVADQAGYAYLSFTVPSTAPVGECTITATGDSGRTVTTPFTVSGGLPYTGAQIMFWVMAGLGLAALGAGLLMKRRTANV